MDIREARGADVCGRRAASGSHGGAGGFSASADRGASLVLASADRGLGGSSCLDLSSVEARRGGLLVLVINVSLVVTCTFSVRRSSTARLTCRGLPEAERLWAVDAESAAAAPYRGSAAPVPGTAPDGFDRSRSVLRPDASAADMRGRDAVLVALSAAGWGFLASAYAAGAGLAAEDMVGSSGYI